MSKRERSPNFPQITLDKTIEFAALLFKEAGRTSISTDNAAQGLGYTSINGRSLGVLAALRHYGLLEGQKDQVKLSDLALRIVHPLSDQDKLKAIRECMYRPRLFADIRESRGGLSEKMLAAELYHKEGFTKDGAARAAQIFHENRALIGEGNEAVEGENGLEIEPETPDTHPESENLPPVFTGPKNTRPPTPQKPAPLKPPTGNMIAEISVPLAGNQLTLALVGSDPVLEEDIEDIDMLMDYLKRQLRRKVERATTKGPDDDVVV